MQPPSHTVSQAISRQLERDIAFYQNRSRPSRQSDAHLGADHRSDRREPGTQPQFGLARNRRPTLGAIERSNAYRFYYPVEDVQPGLFGATKVGDKRLPLSS
jgi:hypothetical protein